MHANTSISGGVRTRILGLLAAAALLSGCATSEVGVFNTHTVVPGVLVRGGQPDREGFRELKDHYGIATVVNLNDNTAEREREWVESLGMRYVALPCDGFDPRAETYLAFLNVMSTCGEDGPVFVHCRQGMDRTGMAVGAYRIIVDGWSAEDAIDEMQGYREPLNRVVLAHVPGFLRSIERERDVWASRLETGGDAERVSAPGGGGLTGAGTVAAPERR